MMDKQEELTERDIEEMMRAMRDDLRSRVRHVCIHDSEYVPVLHLGELLASYCHSVNWPPRFRAFVDGYSRARSA